MERTEVGTLVCDCCEEPYRLPAHPAGARIDTERLASAEETAQWFHDQRSGLLSLPLLQVRQETCTKEGHIWQVALRHDAPAFRLCVRCGRQENAVSTRTKESLPTTFFSRRNPVWVGLLCGMLGIVAFSLVIALLVLVFQPAA